MQSFLRFTYAGTEFRHENLDGKICVKILHQNHRLVENDAPTLSRAGKMWVTEQSTERGGL